MTSDRNSIGHSPAMRNTARSIGAVLLVFAALELSLALVSHRLPEPLLWYFAGVQTKAGELEGISRDGRGIDVAFVGSSLVDRGIDASTFEDVTGLATWNGGIPAAQASVLERWTLEEVVTSIEPRLVVVGLSSLELNDNRRKPTIALYDAQRAGRRGILAEIDRSASSFSHLFKHRRQLRRPVSFVDDIRHPGRSAADDLDLDALLADEPARIRDHVLNDYAAGGSEADALRRLLTELSDGHDVEVVVVWMPVPERYVALHPNGSVDFERARATVRAVAAETGTTVLDFAGSFPGEEFSDFTHLTPEAAIVFARRLAEALSEQGVL